jgi:ABC-type multidrug transport system permease subunit
MKPNNLLTVASLLSILLLTLHVTDDIVRGFDEASLMNMIGIVALAVLLYGTLMFCERLSGHIIMLLVSIFAAGMPVIHLKSSRIGDIAHADGGFFFIWTLWALGVIGIFGIIVAAHGLWDLQKRKKARLSGE